MKNVIKDYISPKDHNDMNFPIEEFGGRYMMIYEKCQNIYI